MARPTDTIVRSLSNFANDRRSRIRYYGNFEGLPGNDRVPRRILNDTGFLVNAGFDYLVPSPANVVPETDQRISTVFAIYPYGIQDDYAALTATDLADRRIHDSSDVSPSNRGVTLYPGAPTFYMSAALDQTTLGVNKTATLIQRITSPRNGTAYHVVLARNGDVHVVASLDFQCQSTISIDIAVEGALAISVADWEARSFVKLIETPYTDVQLANLATLFAKLYTVFPSIPRTIVANPTPESNGVAYFFPPGLAGTQPYNFTNGAWRNQQSLFDHSNSDAPAFFQNVTAQGSFNLSTEVFRPLQAPAPSANRTAARSVLGQIDTAGALSVALAAYAELAVPERSYDMQQTPRREFFVQRLQRAHSEADDAGTGASGVAEAGEAASGDNAPTVTNSDPLTYNFETGRWGDGQPY